MRLIRFGAAGKEKPGILLADGTRLDASVFGADYDEKFFATGGLEALSKWLTSNGGSAPKSPAKCDLDRLFAGRARSCASASTSAITRRKPEPKFQRSRSFFSNQPLRWLVPTIILRFQKMGPKLIGRLS